MEVKGLIPDILAAGGQQRAETPSILHITIIQRHKSQNLKEGIFFVRVCSMRCVTPKTLNTWELKE